MGSRLVLLVLILSLAAVTGCGGGEENKYTANAPIVKPLSLGAPAAIAEGVSTFGPSHFVAKDRVNGELRIWVLGNRVPVRNRELLTWDPTEKIFADASKSYRYDIQGNPLHKGRTKGKPAQGMDLYNVYIDSATGEVMTKGGALKPKERTDPNIAYVVVP